jgi:hypothetical protein
VRGDAHGKVRGTVRLAAPLCANGDTDDEFCVFSKIRSS